MPCCPKIRDEESIDLSPEALEEEREWI